MTDHAQIEHFIDWANTFDPSLLQSEDDVETKFVLPFFQHLGYLEEYRRGKYPVDYYQPGKPGRKPEIDQIYFSTPEPNKQNANICSGYFVHPFSNKPIFVSLTILMYACKGFAVQGCHRPMG